MKNQKLQAEILGYLQNRGNDFLRNSTALSSYL